MTESSLFPTFCHIGEYDDYGYQVLHRMLAVSQPLILWAPTSALLESEQCRIPPKNFLRHVEEGRIRVFAREQWLLSRDFRDSYTFPEARWDESFDRTLKKMCEDDASHPVEQRRVVAAPPEEGWQWAEEYLADKPSQVTRLNRIARGKTATSKIPAGTLKAAFRFSDDDPFRLAQAILRDAYNHGQAIKLSGAQAPFWLSPTDKTFAAILRDSAAPDGDHGGRNVAASAAPADETSAEIAAQLLDVLRLLDIGAPSLHRGKELDRFLRSEGRQEMVTWLSRVCNLLKVTEAGELDRAVMTILRADVDHAGFSRPLREMIRHPAATAVGSVGLVTTVLGSVTDPTGPVALAGLFAAAFPVTQTLFRSLGYIPADYTGPQWPFLYTYGSPATKRNVTRLLNVLREA